MFKHWHASIFCDRSCPNSGHSASESISFSKFMAPVLHSLILIPLASRYRKSRYADSDEKMAMYTTLMSAYGAAEVPPIPFKFHGTVANTFHAHRVVQHFQETKGVETSDALINSLYRQYFEEEQHPSAESTLMKACADAGIDEKEAKEVVGDESEGGMEVKGLLRETKGNGVDAVPWVMVEGRKRDYTIEGCKEVEEYVKVLELCVKESV